MNDDEMTALAQKIGDAIAHPVCEGETHATVVEAIHRELQAAMPAAGEVQVADWRQRITPEAKAKAAQTLYQECDKALGKAQDTIRKLRAEKRTLTQRLREAEQNDWRCDACGGTGTPLSGKPCMCGDTGRAVDAMDYLRRKLHEAEQELAKFHTLIESAHCGQNSSANPVTHLGALREIIEQRDAGNILCQHNEGTIKRLKHEIDDLIEMNEGTIERLEMENKTLREQLES